MHQGAYICHYTAFATATMLPLTSLMHSVHDLSQRYREEGELVWDKVGTSCSCVHSDSTVTAGRGSWRTVH